MCCLHLQFRGVTVTLKMEAVGLSEIHIPLQTARCHILVNCDHRRLCYNTVREQTAVLCNTEVIIDHV